MQLIKLILCVWGRGGGGNHLVWRYFPSDIKKFQLCISDRCFILSDVIFRNTLILSATHKFFRCFYLPELCTWLCSTFAMIYTPQDQRSVDLLHRNTTSYVDIWSTQIYENQSKQIFCSKKFSLGEMFA